MGYTMRVQPILYALCLMLAACGDAHREAPGSADTDVIRKARADDAQGPVLPLKIAPDLTVRAVRFGLLKGDGASDDDFVPTEEVPPFDGQAFGWIVEVDTTRRSLRWQEHLRMPEPPADWGDASSDPDLVISKDGKSVIAQGEDDVDDGELSRFYWSLATGDPAGDYQMDVAIEGHPVAHLRFHVAATVKEQTLLVRRTATVAGIRFVRVRHAAGARRSVAGRRLAEGPWT